MSTTSLWGNREEKDEHFLQRLGECIDRTKMIENNEHTDRSLRGHRTVRETCSLGSENVKKVLEIFKPSKLQRELFEVFLEKVADQALERKTWSENTRPEFKGEESLKRIELAQQITDLERFDPKHLLLVSTDLERLELRISPGHLDDLATFSRDFLTELGMDTTVGQAKVQRNIQNARECCVERSHSSAPSHGELWCVLDKTVGRAGKTVRGADKTVRDADQTVGSADAGFTLWWGKPTQPLKWSAADVLLPASADKETLMDFVLAESPAYKPTCYSCSFFEAQETTDPKEQKKTRKDSMRSLHFELPDAPRAPLMGLMFFKAMGFAKPEDAVLKALINVEQRSAYVGANLGPGGLTRLFLRLFRTTKLAAEELAGLVGFTYKTEELENVAMILRVEAPEVVEYVAEKRGFTLSVGFVG